MVAVDSMNIRARPIGGTLAMITAAIGRLVGAAVG